MDVAVDLDDVPRAGGPVEAVDVLGEDDDARESALERGDRLVGPVRPGAAAGALDGAEVLPGRRRPSPERLAGEEHLDREPLLRRVRLVEPADAPVGREAGVGGDPGPGDEEDGAGPAEDPGGGVDGGGVRRGGRRGVRHDDPVYGPGAAAR